LKSTLNILLVAVLITLFGSLLVSTEDSRIYPFEYPVDLFTIIFSSLILLIKYINRDSNFQKRFSFMSKSLNIILLIIFAILLVLYLINFISPDVYAFNFPRTITVIILIIILFFLSLNFEKEKPES
jgi:peptidoglycan/LPS O-acetylase OafA/YrhL